MRGQVFKCIKKFSKVIKFIAIVIVSVIVIVIVIVSVIVIVIVSVIVIVIVSVIVMTKAPTSLSSALAPAAS